MGNSLVSSFFDTRCIYDDKVHTAWCRCLANTLKFTIRPMFAFAATLRPCRHCQWYVLARLPAKRWPIQLYCVKTWREYPHNVLHCRSSRSEPQPQLTNVENFLKFGHVVFTARCYASAVLAMAVCPSVRPSVTSRSSTKTAKRRITQRTPLDSPGALVFWRQRSPRNSTEVTPCGGAKYRWGGSKSATFDK